MKLSCKACRAKILAEDVSLERGMAKCRACNAVFDFTDQVERSGGGPSAGKKKRGEVPMPKAIKIGNWGNTLVITRRWFTSNAIFLAFFCVAWDSFLVFWYMMVVGGNDSSPGRWIAILFPICHVAVGVGLTYFTLALFLNQTKIEVKRGELTIRHRPLPWRGNATFNTDDIEQLYLKQKHRQGNNNSLTTTYELHAINTQNSRREAIVPTPTVKAETDD